MRGTLLASTPVATPSKERALSESRLTAGAAPAIDLHATQRRTLTTLSVSQVFGSIGVGVGFAVSALVATSLSSSPAQAGLLQGLSVVGTVAATILLARVSASRGRRPGLAIGYVVAAAGALVAVVGITSHQFLVFLVGGALFSVANATTLQSRFAAADLAPPHGRAAGIALVLWMSTVGAVVGPNLATWGGDVLARRGIDPWAGAYVTAAVAFALAGLVIAVRLRPDPLLLARTAFEHDPGAEAAAPQGQQLRSGARAIARSQQARLALTAMAVAHAAMIGVMAWTPVHMAGSMAGSAHLHGAHAGGTSSQAAIGYVLSAHLAGMYAFSPVMGWAARRLGERTVVVLGLGLTIVSVAGIAQLPGSAGLGLGIGLAGLGIGWSAVLVAGSSLLTSSVAIEQRAASQGVADSAVWVASGLSQVASGWVLGTFGYAWLAVAFLVLVAPVTLWAATGARPRPQR
ncbi:MFS transporter [Cellulomonas chengniuliangii]|uniref:MFS transporter n=1 Tax=Cellulomonas chengniuliangii TaxID=2968084 RepID=A0ABY5KZE4_9CELL|nr:MFS transporter [Cellulomonas chengniuliangii]MCC2307304.1 MFS transporter [Cellulomonas chengniuliangii]UUI75905.1 MFS transporter [Cellulomonas chengniuliangii]